MSKSNDNNRVREPGVEVGYLNDDGELVDEDTGYFHIDVRLSDDTIEALSHGSGTIWELGEDDEMIGVNVRAADTRGFGEWAFKSYVERNYDEGTYEFDLGYRVLRTRAFWTRVAAYGAAFVSAPFILSGHGEALAFTYGVGLMMLLPFLLDNFTTNPMEAAIHE